MDKRVCGEKNFERGGWLEEEGKGEEEGGGENMGC